MMRESEPGICHTRMKIASWREKIVYNDVIDVRTFLF